MTDPGTFDHHHYQQNSAQSGDALALLQSLSHCCASVVFFDPQYREALTQLQYGNEGV
jgi:hypothetical protein